MTNVSGANNRMALDQATILRLYVFHSRLIALYQKETGDVFHLAEQRSALPPIHYLVFSNTNRTIWPRTFPTSNKNIETYTLLYMIKNVVVFYYKFFKEALMCLFQVKNETNVSSKTQLIYTKLDLY